MVGYKTITNNKYLKKKNKNKRLRIIWCSLLRQLLVMLKPATLKLNTKQIRYFNNIL